MTFDDFVRTVAATLLDPLEDYELCGRTQVVRTVRESDGNGRTRYTAWVSLTDRNLLDPVTHFVGLQNYTDLMHDSYFWNAVWNTLAIWVIYDHPDDHPDSYVLRPQFAGPGGKHGISDIAYASNNLDALRRVMRAMGLTRMERLREDDPKILEVWL